MLKLKTIKGKQSDTQYTKYVFKTVDLIKSMVNLSSDYPFYLLSWHKSRQIFLNNKKLYVAKTEFDYDEKHNPILESAKLTELSEIKLYYDSKAILADIDIDIIIRNDEGSLWFEDIMPWLEEPSEINREVDLPYHEVIKFLNNYNKETFRTGNYLFYPKADGDSNFTFNIYAYDLKNKVEMKLYIPDKTVKQDDEWINIVPETSRDIIIDDLGNKISAYQKRQVKKDFIEYANQINEEYNIKNYWLMELVKLTISPIDELHEWSCHRIFCNQDKFSNIWVYDFPSEKEEPSFMITDSPYIQDTTKVAVLDFKSPKYHFEDIYKRGNVKRKSWIFNEQEIKELIDFLQSPSEKIEGNETSRYYRGYKKYVKTNWQQLIFEYNHNTAYWDIDEPISNKVKGEIEQLPFDLPIPNYLELAKRIDEENEELGATVKELSKPENLMGPFKSTEEMMKNLLDEKD